MKLKKYFMNLFIVLGIAAAILIFPSSAYAASVSVRDGAYVPQNANRFFEVIPSEEAWTGGTHGVTTTGTVTRFQSPTRDLAWLYSSSTISSWEGTFNFPSGGLQIQFANCDNNDGPAEIYVDDVLVHTVNTYNPTGYKDIIVYVGALSYTPHKVKIQTKQNIGINNDVSLDYVAFRDNDRTRQSGQSGGDDPSLPVDGTWSFHNGDADGDDGWLHVIATIDGEFGEMLFEGEAHYCEELEGEIPLENEEGEKYNDLDFWFELYDGSGDSSRHKSAVPEYDYLADSWVLRIQSLWTNYNVEGKLTMPLLDDPSSPIYVVMDPSVWLDNPGSFQDTYEIDNGECDDLPGYLIGTTSINFDPDADPNDYPFSTSPLTGTVSRTGEIILVSQMPTMPTADLGDAPDSSHSGDPNTIMHAYTNVQADFPTVYVKGSPPYGPIHHSPLSVAYLGSDVSLEFEADILLDEDPNNNIIPSLDISDLDGADDGVDPLPKLPYCRWTTFDYKVTVVDPGVDLYANVWFDWTRDGDWDDDPNCPCCTPGLAPEWAVRNQLLYNLPAGENTVTTTAFRTWHPDPDEAEEIWMRISLSEQPWTFENSAGSGPAEGYQYGETEDYLYTPDTSCEECANLNCDGIINLEDFVIFAQQWLKSCVP
ncbi:MAG: hypothetical protein ISS71_05470 [Phycisphaerae bacterium]|nr:hypothetical protein [Phycisphaerae bacterium]